MLVYVPDRAPDSVFVISAYGLTGKPLVALPKTEKEEATMKRSRFPAEWSEARVRKVLAHYEAQTETEAVAEDEAGIESSETVMSVPHDLLPVIRELIAKRRNRP